MRRFYISKKDIIGDSVVISGSEAHHIKDVIRLKEGDKFIGLDGKGNLYTCSIKTLTKDKIRAIILEKKKLSYKLPKITLACAISKSGTMDYIIQKSSELGVECVIPVKSERTIIRLDKDKCKTKISRWRRIAKESSKQCGRENILNISEPVRFRDLLENTKEYDKRLIASLREDARALRDISIRNRDSKVIILVGPEGDFTSTESDAAIKSDFIPISLGPLVLRVDTACLYVLSVLMSQLS